MKSKYFWIVLVLTVFSVMTFFQGAKKSSVEISSESGKINGDTQSNPLNRSSLQPLGSQESLTGPQKLGNKSGLTQNILSRNLTIPSLDTKNRHHIIKKRTLSNDSNVKIQPNSSMGIEQIKKSLGLSSQTDQLTLTSGLPSDSTGTEVYRYTPKHKNIPVFGTEVIFNSNHSGGAVSEEIIADLVSSLPQDLPTAPKVLVESAIQEATSDVLASLDLGSIKPKLVSSELVYLPGDERVKLSWHLVLETPLFQDEKGVHPQGSWNYFVDALDNTVLKKFDSNRSVIQQANGIGSFRGQPKNISGLDVSPTGNAGPTPYFQADVDRFVTYDFKSGTSFANRTVVTGPIEGFGIPEGNNVHFFTEQILDMLSSDFGFNSIDENGFKIKSNVNVGSGFENAFWDGQLKEMFYGNGGVRLYPFSSDPSIATHEIHHGFTNFHAKLNTTLDALSLNESFSDIAAIHMKWRANLSTANFIFGDALARNDGDRQSKRDLCDPTVDNYYVLIIPGSIDHMSAYPQLVRDAEMLATKYPKDYDRDSIVSHFANGISNKAFCRLAKRFSSNGNPEASATREGVKKAAKLFYLANRNKWMSGESFYTASLGTRLVAQDLPMEYSFNDLNMLTNSWQDVGVLPPNPTLNAPQIINETSVRLTWNSNNNTVRPTVINGYFIFIKKPNEDYTFLAQVLGGDTSSYDVTQLKTGENYSFLMLAANSGGSSLPSNIVSITPSMQAPMGPSSLLAIANNSTEIRLSWTDNSLNESQFVVERKIGPSGNYSVLATLTQNSTSYISNALTPNTTYFFRVQAKNQTGNSSYSNESSATTPDVIPSSPTILGATAVSANSIRISWRDNSNNEQGFKIERSPNGVTSFVQIGTVTGGVTTFLNTGLNKSTTYYYRVRSYNAVGNSQYTGTASTRTPSR